MQTSLCGIFYDAVLRLLLDHCQGVTSDQQFFVCRDDPDLYLGIRCGDFLQLALEIVGSLVNLDAQIFHVLADFLTAVRCIFADAAGEDHSVQTVHGCGIGTDILLDIVYQHILCQGGTLVAQPQLLR